MEVQYWCPDCNCDFEQEEQDDICCPSCHSDRPIVVKREGTE